MKTIFDINTRQELIARIQLINDDSPSRWGEMNVYQMLKHCSTWDDMMLGKIQVKPVFLGKIFGRLALKNVLKNDKPLGKNAPTTPELKIRERTGDIILQKSAWIKRIHEYGYFDKSLFIHPFFGSMTREQVGKFVYKHHDHHLRQFGG